MRPAKQLDALAYRRDAARRMIETLIRQRERGRVLSEIQQQDPTVRAMLAVMQHQEELAKSSAPERSEQSGLLRFIDKNPRVALGLVVALFLGPTGSVAVIETLADRPVAAVDTKPIETRVTAVETDVDAVRQEVEHMRSDNAAAHEDLETGIRAIGRVLMPPKDDKPKRRRTATRAGAPKSPDDALRDWVEKH